MDQASSSGPIAFLGPELSYSHLAVESHFGPLAKGRLMPRETIVQVFEAVEQGRADFGLVPVENSTEGSVNITLDRLVETGLAITGETTLAIRHALMSRAEDAADLTWVASHPQALAQCRTWLGKNLPGVELRSSASTAAGAQLAKADPAGAAIAGRPVAEALGLKILARNIGDIDPNWTRFLILSREPAGPTGNDKTSVLVGTAHQPGSLHSALGPIAGHRLNLTRIESRPSRERPWEYVFFIDFLGHAQDEEVALALKELALVTHEIKVLGSFPAGDKPHQAKGAGK